MAVLGSTTMRQRFSRLSTAIKMLIILGVALFPLGLVAVLASVDAARDGRAEREAMARISAVESAGLLDALVAKDALALSMVAASTSIRGLPEGPCALMRNARAARNDIVVSRFALFDRAGKSLCADEGLPPDPVAPSLDATDVRLDAHARGLRITSGAEAGYAVAWIDLAAMQTLVTAAGQDGDIDVSLESGGERVQLVDRYEPGVLQRTIVSRARLAGSDVFAIAAVGAIPISAVEIATILLPLIMWLAAALLGWLVVDRLLLRPIVSMQQAVLAYQPGGRAIDVPETFTPATEIRDLGQAFARVTATIAVHEAELEAAIARQARLVREVHHRVKNNLQVVASLLNLHARGAKSTDASNAYATIQRRVDALAVVHRNHFAELEDDRGVALRPLLSELTGNLRATAPEGASGMAIMLDLDPVYVNQDVAVSVAFFVTEIVEHAMLCAPHEPVGVTLRQLPSPTGARLILSSASLKTGAVCDNTDSRQFERITTGLSRQLRAVLDRDGEAGSFGIDITIQAATQPN